MLRWLDAGPGGDFHGSLELGASFVAEQPAARRAAPLCVDGFGLCLELHAFLSHLKKINEEITVLWWLFFMCFICRWLDIVWDQSVCSSNPELAAISGVSEVMLLKFGNFPWPPGLMECRLYLVIGFLVLQRFISSAWWTLGWSFDLTKRMVVFTLFFTGVQVSRPGTCGLLNHSSWRFQPNLCI